MRNNQNLKYICRALELCDEDIVEIMRLGGSDISKSRANGFRRGAGKYRKPDHGAHNPQELERRMKIMSDDEFDAFCAGLVEYYATTPPN